MAAKALEGFISLDTSRPIWWQFFTVAPLVVIGTRENDAYDLAPKHMVTPLGQDNYFGFVCTPRHSTYRNVRANGFFTVSFPRPDQVTMAGLAATGRCEDDDLMKPIVQLLPTFPAPQVDALLLKDAYLFLECALDRVVDGFGAYSLIAGKVTGAYVDENAMRISESDEQELIRQYPLLAYLAYGRFASIGASFAFPYPREFKN